MTEPNWVASVAGGVMIGVAAVLLLLFNGRIAGVAGILGGLLTSPDIRERLWRGAFVVGLVAGAGIYKFVRGEIPMHMQADTLWLIVAGILVGAGTRLGSGCTSGHGVCGLARRSTRSLFATATFMAVAILTVFFLRQVAR